YTGLILDTEFLISNVQYKNPNLANHSRLGLNNHYFFNFANCSASALFLKSSCCLIYLFTSFLETRWFSCFFFRSFKVARFSRWPDTQVNVLPLPSPNLPIVFVHVAQLAFVFL